MKRAKAAKKKKRGDYFSGKTRDRARKKKAGIKE
jgi:hypothetical protein